MAGKDAKGSKDSKSSKDANSSGASGSEYCEILHRISLISFEYIYLCLSLSTLFCSNAL